MASFSENVPNNLCQAFQIVVAWIPKAQKEKYYKRSFLRNVAISQPKNIGFCIFSSQSQEDHEAVKGYPTFIQKIVRTFGINDFIKKLII